MNSLILKATSRILLIFLLLFSLFLLLRGHDLPGGGFVGGLVGAGAWALYAIAHGPVLARYTLRFDPRTLSGTGLLVALLSGFVSVFRGQEPFKGQWIEFAALQLGSPMLFDVGVYLIVMGATLTIIFALEEA